MLDIDDLKGHGSSAVYGILGTTSRTKSAVTTKRYKFKSAAGGAAIHGATESWITTVNHALNVFDGRLAGMQCI